MPRGKKPPARRTFLKSIVGVSALGFAGCLGDDPDPAPPATDDTVETDDDPIEDDDDNGEGGFWERDARPRVSDRTQLIDIAPDCEPGFNPDELPLLAVGTDSQWNIRCAGYNFVIVDQPDDSTWEDHPDPVADGNVPVRMSHTFNAAGEYVVRSDGPDGEESTLAFEVVDE